MIQSIHDIFNIVDRYITLTSKILLQDLPPWEEVAYIQERIEFLIQNSDHKAKIYSEVTVASDDQYSNMLRFLTDKYSKLSDQLEGIGVKKIEFFLQIFEREIAWMDRQLQQQEEKTRHVRQEFGALDKSLEFSWYGITDEEFSQFRDQVEKNKKKIEPLLQKEITELNRLYSEQRIFIEKNAKYIKSSHRELLNYLEQIKNDIFIKPFAHQNNENILRNYDLVKIFESFGNELFDNVSEDDFLIVFQGGKINSLLNLKNGVFNKIYFLIHNLSEQINDEKKIEWVNHILSSIHWKNSPTNIKLLERIRQKRKDADKNFKNNLAKIISIEPSELESPSRR